MGDNYISAGDNTKFRSVNGDYWAGMKKSELDNQPSEKFIFFEMADSGVGNDVANDGVLGEHEIIEVRKGELLSMQEDIKKVCKNLRDVQEKLDDYTGKSLGIKDKTAHSRLLLKQMALQKNLIKLEQRYAKEVALTLDMADASGYRTNFNFILEGEAEIDVIKTENEVIHKERLEREKNKGL